MLTGSVIIVLFLSLFIGWFYPRRKRMRQPASGWRKKPAQANHSNTFPRHPPKPEWVKQEVIRLKALMPNKGQIKIAQAFNRLHEHTRNMTVGKTYAGYTIKHNQYEIQILRRNLKHQRPRSVPPHLIWGMDLTGKTDTQGKQHHILGIVEHHSRVCLRLEALSTKASIMLLRQLLDTIESLGHIKPCYLRTDNEAVFTSGFFRLGLWLLRIKHQRTEIACPWMNGRIERFFGTLKAKLDQWEIDSLTSLNHSLHLFQFWYNHVRPHQYLDGLTPAEAWQGKTNFKRNNNEAWWFDEWGDY